MKDSLSTLIEKEKNERTGILDLSSIEFNSIPRSIFELTELEDLTIKLKSDKPFWSSKIRPIEIPEEISRLKKLKKLTINGGVLQPISLTNLSIVSNLKNIEKLSLENVQYNEVSFLSEISNLQSLSLSSCEIDDIHQLGQLNNLKSLSIRLCPLKDIDFIGQLNKLEYLNLSNTRIRSISSLSALINLNHLELSVNFIQDISPLQFLENLSYLNLSNNEIELCGCLKDLKKINTLNLRSNKISNVQSILSLLKMNISLSKNDNNKGLQIKDNPIEIPPNHILELGDDAVLNWYEQINDQGTHNLYEARIIIVGESGAGKTTLYKKLEDEKIVVPIPKLESTHGININSERIFNHHSFNGIEIKTTIWDFGGQDTQNYLHQYFYAKDNLFILVCDHRSEKYRFDYWFEVITRLCSESRIIVVRNQKERVTASQFVNLTEYEERFTGLKISCVDVDFKDNDARWNLLIHTIEENLSLMERVNQQVPKTWKPIRDKIQQLKVDKRSHIDMSEFQKICEESGLIDPQFQALCLDYLHWLGYALHYNDPALVNTIFIDPEWITKGLYEILREENYLAGNKGRFSKHDIQKIWKGKSTSDQNLLLNLLLKDSFEVCYRVDNTDSYLVPVLISNIKSEPVKPQILPYTLRFKFPFMPFGFFSRLIVRLYDKVWGDFVWLTGSWLKTPNNCKAKMEHFKDLNTGEEVFEISIFGEKKERKELLSEIRNEIFHIRKILFPNLIIEEQVPCFCEKCLNLKTPYFHSRNAIEKMAAQNQFYSQCKESGKLIPTDQLLDSIIDSEELKRQYKEMGKEGTYIHIHDIGKSEVHVDTNAQAEALAKAIATNTVTITINNILGEIQNLKEDFVDEKDLLLRHIDEVEYSVVHKEIEKAENAVQEIETSSNEGKPIPAKVKSRLSQFISNLTDEKTTLGKCVKLLGNGVDFATKLVSLYGQLPLS